MLLSNRYTNMILKTKSEKKVTKKQRKKKQWTTKEQTGIKQSQNK